MLFSMFVLRFAESETFVETVLLKIHVVEPQRSLAELGNVPLVVSEFYSLSNVINSSVLTFKTQPDVICTVRLLSSEINVPVLGQLVVEDPEFNAGFWAWTEKRYTKYIMKIFKSICVSNHSHMLQTTKSCAVTNVQKKNRTLNKSLKISDNFTLLWQGKVSSGCHVMRLTPPKNNNLYQLIVHGIWKKYILLVCFWTVFENTIKTIFFMN